jgi:hypothetical protein
MIYRSLFRIAAVALFAGNAAAVTAAEPREPEAVIAILNGSVDVNGESAALGSPLKEGDTVSVPEGSEVEIRFRNGRAWTRLKGEASMTLEKSGRKTSLSLVKGWIMSLVQPQTKFSVKGPAAAASVRGTVFFMQADAEGTYVCVCEGTIKHSAGKKSRNVTADHHAALLTKPDGATAAAGMAHHTDEDVEHLRRLARNDPK